MMGSGNGDDRGLVPRAVERVLGSVERLSLQGWEYSVSVAVLEIYGERMRDLLNPHAREVSDINAIKHDASGHATVAGACYAGLYLWTMGEGINCKRLAPSIG